MVSFSFWCFQHPSKSPRYSGRPMYSGEPAVFTNAFPNWEKNRFFIKRHKTISILPENSPSWRIHHEGLSARNGNQAMHPVPLLIQICASEAC